ncbi:MAG: DUF2249 domain-containing protein [Streptosporangiaceae bacterium]
MTITEAEAYEAMLAHHQALEEGLTARAEAVTGAVAAGQPPGTAVADLIAYLAEEVLPHAAAEEATIYRAAAAQQGLTEMIGGMLAEHVTLTASATRLAAAADGAAAASESQQIAGLFAAHAAKENEALLPALLVDDSVDLTDLLEDMHATAGHGRTPGEGPGGGLPGTGGSGIDDGHSESAVPEPPVPAQGAPDLDVRELAPALRHQTIFDTYRALPPGTGFVLVNDHDPKPLRYQFEAEHAGQFTWSYLESGPRVWRVRIGRAGA